MGRRTGVEKSCEQCGVLFYVAKSRSAKAQFCSVDCKGLASRGRHARRNVERDAAIARGEKFYFTGEPCALGHISMWYVTAFKCVDCSKDEMADKRRKTEERRAARPASPRQRAQENGDTRYSTGKPCPRGHLAQRLTANGACVDCAREDTARREAGNQEVSDSRKIYRRENAERYRSHCRTRRAKLSGADGSHSQRDIDAIWDKQRGRCAYCRRRLDEGYHVDHINPVSKGGSNKRSNLQLTCKKCNLSKHNKTPEDFARSIGRLI